MTNANQPISHFMWRTSNAVSSLSAGKPKTTARSRSCFRRLPWNHYISLQIKSRMSRSTAWRNVTLTIQLPGIIGFVWSAVQLMMMRLPWLQAAGLILCLPQPLLRQCSIAPLKHRHRLHPPLWQHDSLCKKAPLMKMLLVGAPRPFAFAWQTQWFSVDSCNANKWSV